MTNQKHAAIIADWVRTHSRVGARCGNCGKPFTAARKAKGVAGIPNGAGYSLYVLCRPCV